MENEKEEIKVNAEIQDTNSKDHAQQIQVYNIITSKDPSWQTIIYDLISTEQLDPWNIDLAKLCKGYFEKIREMQEADFFISSKVLLAASFLLRIKSDFLLDRYIPEIDNILFKKEEKIEKTIEKIEIDEDLIPILTPKSPLPRLKKVTLQELINALDFAIKTESRRIHKEIEKKQAERLSYVDIPKFRRINIKDRIRHFYAKVLTNFKNKRPEIKLAYSHITGSSKEEKIACFLPMLHLSNTNKLWLEQEKHLSEIYIYLYEEFKKNFPEHDKDLKEGKEDIEMFEQIEDALHADLDELQKNFEEGNDKDLEFNKDFENPLADLIDESVEE